MAKLAALLVIIVGVAGALAFGAIQFNLIPDYTGLIKPVEARADAPPPPPPRIDPVFMDVEPILIPVIRDGEIKQNVYISFRLELVPGQGPRSVAFKHRAALRDVYVRALFELVPNQLAERDVLDVEAVKQRLLDITLRVLGSEVVKDVVMLAVFYR